MWVWAVAASAGVLLIVIVIVLLVRAPYTSRVDYMKEIVALPEGTDGLSVYIILADANGRQVRAKGVATLTVSRQLEPEDVGLPSDPRVYESHSRKILYQSNLDIMERDFQMATIGMGEFQHEALILSFPRISYQQLSEKVGRGGRPYATISVSFTEEDGKQVSGDSDYSF